MKLNALNIKSELDRISELANVCRTENTNIELSSRLADLDSSLEEIKNKIEESYYYMSGLTVDIVEILRKEGKPFSPHQIAVYLYGDGNFDKHHANNIAKILRNLARCGVLIECHTKPYKSMGVIVANRAYKLAK
jgi:hypothetical protein